ncbi:hypothetical protein BJY04DRAFT_224295 [Aspergillus karnatakaensis]|uniref:uncharacterized protein n=1 Tax=Aspergillus karnatakaensis TaxID=1810916 RepID=UPI003CCCD614
MVASTQAIATPVFLSITSYNCLELFIWLLDIFHRRDGVYFYSMLIATIGLTGWTIMCFLQIYAAAHYGIGAGIAFSIFVSCLTTGHAFTLYSRLHLLLCPQFGSSAQHPRLLRGILIMVIVSSVIFCGPVVAAATYLNHRQLRGGFWVSRISFTLNIAREFFLYGVYLVCALRQLHPIIRVKGKVGQKVMLQLITIQVIAIILDIFYLLINYVGGRMHITETLLTSVMSFLYMLKLKMEFVILNRLILLLTSPVVALDSSLGFVSIGEASTTTASSQRVGLCLDTEAQARIQGQGIQQIRSLTNTHESGAIDAY